MYYQPYDQRNAKTIWGHMVVDRIAELNDDMDDEEDDNYSEYYGEKLQALTAWDVCSSKAGMYF